MHRNVIAIATAALTAGAAGAQDLPLPGEVTSLDDLSAAAETLAGMAADKLLVRDLLGQPLVGAEGAEIGTVENFVVLPGGNLVAALVETSDGGRIAVPFSAVKLGAAVQGAPMELPFAASEVAGLEALSSLADTLSQ